MTKTIQYNLLIVRKKIIGKPISEYEPKFAPVNILKYSYILLSYEVHMFTTLELIALFYKKFWILPQFISQKKNY